MVSLLFPLAILCLLQSRFPYYTGLEAQLVAFWADNRKTAPGGCALPLMQKIFAQLLE
jgi:hypothetical protein